MTAEAYCDCVARPAMIRLHVAHAHRFYLCQRCGAVREDIYQTELSPGKFGTIHPMP